MELKHFDAAVEWWNNRRPIQVDGFDKAREFSAMEIRDGKGLNGDSPGLTQRGQSRSDSTLKGSRSVAREEIWYNYAQSGYGRNAR